MDHRAVGLDLLEVAVGTDPEAHAECQPVDALSQGTEIVREPLRQHGDAQTRQVDARRSTAGLGVDERPATDVTADIGDVDLDLDGTAVDGPGAHRVVEVARSHRIDGDRGASAQIPAAGKIALGDHIGQRVRLGLDLGGEVLDDAKEPQHRPIDGAGILGPAEPLEQDAARVLPPTFYVVDAHRHQFAFPGFALDLRGADFDDKFLPAPERTDVRPVAAGDPHPHHLGGPALDDTDDDTLAEPEQSGAFLRRLEPDEHLVAVQRAAPAARRDPHRRAVVAIDIDDEAAPGHAPVAAGMEIGVLSRKIPLAAPEDDLAPTLELGEHAAQRPPCVGSPFTALVVDLGHQHAQAHALAAAATNGIENLLGVEIFLGVLVSHRRLLKHTSAATSARTRKNALPALTHQRTCCTTRRIPSRPQNRQQNPRPRR